MIEVEGVVVESQPNTTFQVDIGNGHTILAHISGKLRMNFIRILPGDKVTVEMSTVKTADGKNAAHYENTILITAGEPELLTDPEKSLV